MKDIRTRFAPSPTGYLHIGGIRTALFSWLFARHHNGKFVLRIEDTDRERSTQEAIEIILNGMQWLGLDAAEGPFYQSERTERYLAVIDQLLAEDKAYYCYCSKDELDAMRQAAMQRGEKPKYDGRCRHRTEVPAKYDSRVVRFRTPDDGEVTVADLIQGTVTYRNSELDDLIIARSDGAPTYNLTVVVDDMDMRISHVIRGDDHLNNTPRQIHILKALGATQPDYAHIPLILGEDGKKLSKRHGAASVLQYRDSGILADALLNYLVRLGWSHGDQEIFSREEMIDLFDLENINRSAAAINPDKLLWLNQHYMKETSSEELVPLLKKQLTNYSVDISTGPSLLKVCEVQKERVKTLLEMAEQSRYFFEDFKQFDEQAAKKHLRPVVLEPLAAVYTALESLQEWESERLHAVIIKVTESLEIKLGKIAQPLRVAVTGSSVSPSIDITLELIGRERVLQRINMALEYIRQRA